MKQQSSSPQSAIAFGQQANLIESAYPYALSSDLARLCLPITFRDPNKKLAWVNSICLLFLLIGLVGLKMPKFQEKQLAEIVEIVPVVFNPPEEPPATKPEVRTDEPEPLLDTTTSDTPVIATVVAADASKVAFAVPVKGPVILAPARFAAPPPVDLRPAPPKPATFIPRSGDGGRYPDPPYPRLALQQRQQGKLTLYVVVDASGKPKVVEVRDSSGYSLLDRHAAEWVKDRWQWPAEEVRYYYVPVIFQIK